MLDIAILLQIIGFILGLVFGTTFISPTIERILKTTKDKSYALSRKWLDLLYVFRGKKIDFEWVYIAFFYVMVYTLAIRGFFQEDMTFLYFGITLMAALIAFSTIVMTYFLEETRPGEKTKWHNPFLWLKNLVLMTYVNAIYIPLIVSPLVTLAVMLTGVHLVAKHSSNRSIRIIIAFVGSVTMLAGLIIEFIAI